MNKLINKIKENKMAFISIIAILFIPVLYAGNFISAFKDPYNNLNQVSVAIVNNDKTIVSNEEEVNIGNTFVESLKETDNFKWVFVTEEEANKGMEDNKYYFTVKIPEDFTSNIYSTLNGTPKTANLIYQANDNNNYISGVLGNALITKLNAKLNEEVITKFVTTLGTSLEGVNDLSVGVTALASGSSQLNSGLSTAKTGAATLSESTEKIATSTTNLSTGINTLSDSYNTFNSSLNTASTSLSKLSAGYTSLDSGLKAYEAQLELAINTNTSLTTEQKTALITTYKTLLANSAYLNTNLTTVTNGITTLNTNSKTINTSLSTINTGTKTLLSYLLELNKGTKELSTGITSLYSGSQTLNSGLTELNTGVSTLKTSVEDLNLVDNASNLSNPVTETSEAYSQVENYGYGFAPYFVSLGLFVGALITTIVIKAKNEKKNKKEQATFKSIMKKIGLYAVIVVTQALILDAIVLTTTITVTNPLGFITFTVLISLMYMALIQALSTLFGDPGRFIAIILLILQLTACGGTFPVETAPSFYNAIHSFMPMTYTVEGLRAIIGNGNMSILGNSCIILSIITLVSYLLIFIYFKKSKKFI